MKRSFSLSDENRRLKRQLSISQNQLIALLGEQQKNELNHHSIEEDGENGGEEAEEDPPCAKHHVSAQMKLFTCKLGDKPLHAKSYLFNNLIAFQSFSGNGTS